jgi:DNA-binding LytR/AlgR family response regulator
MPKILYIEYDDVIRENVLELLREEGFSAIGARNGNEGIIKIEETAYDLILCDISLPDMNGISILEGYKIRFGSFPPPFIFISALNDKKIIRRGMEVGADDYLQKPFLLEELLSAINVQLGKRKAILSKSEDELLELKGAIENLSRIADDKDHQKAYNYEDSVFFSTADKSQFIFINEIVYIKASGDYSRIFMKNKKSWLIKNSIKAWCSILPPNHFIQIRRSVIVNVNSVVSVQKWFNYTHQVLLKDIDEPFIMSQRYSRKLKNIFNKKKESSMESYNSIRKKNGSQV